MHIKPTDDIGFANEAKVSEALTTLQKEPQKYGLPTAIIGFIWAKRNSALDRKHIDFLVTLEEDRRVPLQVKSSKRGKSRHTNLCQRLGLSIPCIVVSIHDALESVIAKVVEVIKLVGNAVRRKENHIAHLDRMKAEKRTRKEEQRLQRRHGVRQFYRHHAFQMCH